MARLYIANCTKQVHEFCYRVPADDGAAYSRTVRTQRIDPGTQQLIHTETALQILEAIVDQHVIYGLLPAAEVVRTKNFVGLCFSFDKPVTMEAIAYALDRNEGVNFDRAEERREINAIGVADALEGIGEQLRHDGRRVPPLRGVDVETLEDGDDPKFAHAIRVDKGVPRADGRVIQPARRPARA
jgi:hypothetical protein